MDQPFEIVAPDVWTAPSLFNSPHSGRQLPQGFLSRTRLSQSALRKSEDCYIDELFSGCVAHGAPLLKANVARCYIDLNREPYELDPRMFVDPLPGYANTASPRVAGGLGTIPRVVAEGEEIYRARLHFREALSRIDTIYRPYHRTLLAMCDEVQRKYGSVLVVDCHSMPSSAAVQGQTPAARQTQVDVVLGDRFGASCGEPVVDCVEDLLRGAGLRTVRNRPYAGGFITQNYGSPANGRHALQIEINRALYLDEATLEKRPSFSAVCDLLAKTIACLFAELPNILEPRRLAAE